MTVTLHGPTAVDTTITKATTNTKKNWILVIVVFVVVVVAARRAVSSPIAGRDNHIG